MSDTRHPLPSAALALASCAVAVAIGLTVHHPAATASPDDAGFVADELGYVDSGARCDRSQALMAYGRTTRSLVAICVEPSGQLQYRGERISDGSVLSIPAGRSPDGSIVATNDDVTYAVSPTMFLVSEGDTVLYRDSWTEFHQPRFSPGSTTSTSSSATTSSSAPATPTVSTTTVTMAPRPGS